MQQRVALCRALVLQPKLLLMDEPFGALDELTRMEMQDLLLDIRAKTGATVMLVTHSISEAVYLSDKIAVFSPRPAKIADFIAVDFPIPGGRKPDTRLNSPNSSIELAGHLGLHDEPAKPRTLDLSLDWPHMILAIWQLYTSLSGISPWYCLALWKSRPFPSNVTTCCCRRLGRPSSRQFWDSGWRW